MASAGQSGQYKSPLLTSSASSHDRLSPRRRALLFALGTAAIILAGAVLFAVLLGGGSSSSSSDQDESADAPSVQPRPILHCEAAGRQLINELTAETSAHLVWNRLSVMCDTFGPRLSGTQALEDAIDWLEQQFIADGLERVEKQGVMVPTWVRGEESLRMVVPRLKEMSMLGLGGSVGTSAGPLNASILVVNSFDELKANCSLAERRIVVFNEEWAGSYGATVAYRRNGAAEAAKCGAVAALVRSITPLSLYTPHTGSMAYEIGVPQIPTAAITVEDALLLARLQQRGQDVFLVLSMEADTKPDSLSHNIMAELTGTEFPKEVVVIGGHIDSWDIGLGAVDDAGGVFVAWHALRAMKMLGLRPKRTVRVVGWTNEENGMKGAEAYLNLTLHRNESVVLALESDSGATAAYGIGFTGSLEAREALEEIGAFIKSTGASFGQVLPSGGGADVGPLASDPTLRAPVGNLATDDSRYFWVHHTNADTPDKLAPKDMADGAATLAVFSYCVADATERLPR